jgi:hypothetical protein
MIGGGLGALGSIGSALIGSSAAEKASKQQVAAQMAALNLQAGFFDKAQSALSPIYSMAPDFLTALKGIGSTGAGAMTNLANVGSNLTQGANSPLATLTQLLTPGPSMTSTLSNLPGMKFLSEYGNIAAQNQLSTQGLASAAGPVGRAISDYNQGLAQTSWGTLVGQLQNLVNTGTGALSTAAGLGTSAYGTGAGLGTQAAGALAGSAGQFGALGSQSLGNIGTAQAQGTLGSANAISGGLTGLTGSVSNALMMSKLLGGGAFGNSTGASSSGSIYGGGFSPAQVGDINSFAQAYAQG